MAPDVLPVSLERQWPVRRRGELRGKNAKGGRLAAATTAEQDNTPAAAQSQAEGCLSRHVLVGKAWELDANIGVSLAQGHVRNCSGNSERR
jgi:hypothetical protein